MSHSDEHEDMPLEKYNFNGNHESQNQESNLKISTEVNKNIKKAAENNHKFKQKVRQQQNQPNQEQFSQENYQEEEYDQEQRYQQNEQIQSQQPKDKKIINMQKSKQINKIAFQEEVFNSQNDQKARQSQQQGLGSKYSPKGSKILQKRENKSYQLSKSNDSIKNKQYEKYEKKQAKQFNKIRYTYNQVQNKSIQLNFDQSIKSQQLQKSQQTNKNVSEMVKKQPIKKSQPQEEKQKFNIMEKSNKQLKNNQNNQNNWKQNDGEDYQQEQYQQEQAENQRQQNNQKQAQSHYEMSTSLDKKKQIVQHGKNQQKNKSSKNAKELQNSQNLDKSQEILTKKSISNLNQLNQKEQISLERSNLTNHIQKQNNYQQKIKNSNNFNKKSNQLSQNQQHRKAYYEKEDDPEQRNLQQGVEQIQPNPIEHNKTDQYSQEEQQTQQKQYFDLQRYKNVEQILQNLLHELKSTLKAVKNQRANNFSSENGKNMGTRFFSRASRNQSNAQYHKSNNKSLMDIIQRRKIKSNGNPNDNLHNITSYNQKPHVSSVAIGNVKGNKNKVIPMGLGQFGNSTTYNLLQKLKGVTNKQINNYNQMNKNNYAEDENQRQKLIMNRTKINQILAASSSGKSNSVHQNGKNKKTGSFFIRNSNNNKSKHYQNRQSGQISSFMNEQDQNNYHSSKDVSMMSQNRKIIKSTNFAKINKQPITSFTEKNSGMNTIDRMKNQKATFFGNNNNIPMAPTFMNIAPLLKHIKKYLQEIAQGHLDSIQLMLRHSQQNIISHHNLNELINRRKLLKTALYLQRASIVAGICYGYIMITDQKGYLLYQSRMQQLTSSKNPTKSSNPSKKQSIQTLKQQTKQILKYMINLVSFSLNNSKLMINTIEQHFLKQKNHFNNVHLDPSQNHQINQAQYNKIKQQQLIQKQILKRNFQTIKLNIQYTQQTFLKLFGQNVEIGNNDKEGSREEENFGESFKNISKLIHKNSIQETFYTLLEYFSFYLASIKRQSSIPFLSVAPNPYLDYQERYTLVIDFIQVFCYGTKKSKNFIFRPYSQHFLQEMSQYYDIVFICDSLPQQIDKIIDILDNKNIIKHRLYKYHLVYQKNTGKYIKSLQRIGRDLSKVILIDTQNNRVLQDSQNTIYINEWKGSKNDSTLAQLCSILISIVVDELDCVKAAQKIDNQMKINYQNGIKYINFGLNLKQQKDTQNSLKNQEKQSRILKNQFSSSQI